MAARAAERNKELGDFGDVNGEPLHLYAVPLHRDGEASGSLLVVYDSSYIHTRVMRAIRDSLLSTLVQTLLITGLALFLVRWAFTSPLGKNRQVAAKLCERILRMSRRHFRKENSSTRSMRRRGTLRAI